MEDTIDLLQIDITKAREELPQESRNSIDSINWKQIVFGMSNKFNPEQLEKLETETELLLCGLLSTEDYPTELETRMKIPKNEVAVLLGEMDRLVFKKIQDELEKRINDNQKFTKEEKPVVFDPTFAGVPQNTQVGIARSEWKENLYKIGQKYNLPVDKLGLLETITTSVLTGETPSARYGSEIKLKINPPEDKADEMISELNEIVFKNIKESMKADLPVETKPKIPLPPYKVINNNQLPITNEGNTNKSIIDLSQIQQNNTDTSSVSEKIKENIYESDVYKEHGIEIISDNETLDKKEIEKEKENNIIINNVQKDLVKPNIISNKLFNKTASQTTITDYSTPKINLQAQPFNRVQGGETVKPHDPYHEAI